MDAAIIGQSLHPNLISKNGSSLSWNEIFSMRDPRTLDWAFLNNPSYIFLTLGTYLYVSKIFGPRLMRDSKPYELRKVIMAYNVFQVIANTYYASMLTYYAYFKLDYSWLCQGVTYQNDPNTMILLDLLFQYLMIRVIDFCDTFFFVARKKFDHISALHVIHHTIVVFSGWLFMRVGPDGQPLFGVILNSMVHIIMYSYYFLSSLGPWIQPYLWWKRYLTRIQIIQFFIMIGYISIPLVAMECGYPRHFIYIIIPQVFLILSLFVNFYVHSYVKKQAHSNVCFGGNVSPIIEESKKHCD